MALGTMSWGGTTDEFEARDMLGAFLEAGGNLIDAADSYNGGAAEEILGRAILGPGLRDAVVIASKAGARWDTPRRFDTSRRHLLDALEGSLRRLDTDVIDLWQLHVWDPRTPLEETLAAAEDAVRAGKVRHVGVSNYCGWQLTEAGLIARERFARAAPVSAQLEYSLVERGIEREAVRAADRAGAGILAWSPLGRGVLTGKYRHGTPTQSRATDPQWAGFVGRHLDERCVGIVDATCTAAEGLGVQPAQLALAWVRDQPGVASAIVGPRSMIQLRPLLEAESVELPEAIRVALDEVSAPPTGYPESGELQL